MKGFGEKILKCIDDVLYPEGAVCIKCGYLSDGKILCDDCMEILSAEKITSEICHRCGHPLKKDGTCGFCHFLGERNIILRAPYIHRGLARELVHMLKYKNVGSAAIPLSTAMAASLGEVDLPKETVVTWVTMPKKRQELRGIDHGRILAENVAKELHLPVRQLLCRDNRKAASTQQGQNLENRQKNLQGLFHPACIIDFPVLLVDDVTTTGSTLITCFDALAEGGMQKMYAATATLAGVDFSGSNFSDEYAPW